MSETMNAPRTDVAVDRLLDERRTARDLVAGPRRGDLPPVAAGLTSWLSAELGTAAGVSRVRRLSGAGTNELYVFDLESPGGKERLVLRIKIPGSGVVTHIGREFQAMHAVAGLLPVPGARWLTHDLQYFGAPAMVVTFETGTQAPRGQETKASGMGTTYPEPLRSKLAPQFVTYEALLHAFDWRASELGEFQIPRPGTTDAIDWRLAFWDRVWQEDRIEDHPTMCLTRDWLWRNRPPVDTVSLLHGDFRNGNFLVDEQRGVITAVLDWEMTWLGDRHADLAYTMFRSFGQVEDGKFLVAGLMEGREFREMYERVSGLPIDPAKLRYYFVFNMYWSNISLLGTGLRNAAAGRTNLDVMYQAMAGQGVMSCAALNSIISKDLT